MNCALVKRNWCTMSRPYIFRTIQFALSQGGAKEWVTRCRESPHLIPLIYHLTLTEDDTESDEEEGAIRWENWELDNAEELSRAMTHAQNLTLDGLIGKTMITNLAPHLAFVKHLGSSAGGLQSIQLECVEFEQPDHLFLYLSNLPGTLFTGLPVPSTVQIVTTSPMPDSPRIIRDLTTLGGLYAHRSFTTATFGGTFFYGF
ncbi:hypothetical protein PM082_021350 [Marasmius tenuissimus]|nr:hypothetical protein PM082_021350 [Marasmius tenuissimus]